MENETQNVFTGRIVGSENNIENQNPVPSFTPTDKGRINMQRKKNSAFISTLIGLAIVLVVTTTVLATKIWDPLWNPFQPNPDKLVLQAFKKTSSFNTFHFKSKIGVSVSRAAMKGNNLMQGDTNINTLIEGDIDKRDRDNPKSQATFNIDTSTESLSFLFGGALRTINKAFYLKVDTIPAPLTLFFAQAGLDMNSWKGKWISFDPKDLGMSMSPSVENQQKLEKEIEQLILEEPIARVTKRLKGDKIEGQDTYHYLMSVNKENLKQFLVKIPTLIDKYNIIPGANGSLNEKEQKKMFKDMDEFFDKTGGLDFEIWINKKYKVINKIQFRKTFNIAQFGEVEPKKGEYGKVVLDIATTYSKFNQQVKITVPKESTSIMELLGPLMQGFMGNTRFNSSSSSLLNPVNNNYPALTPFPEN